MKTFFLSIIFFLSFSFLGIAQNDQDLIPLKSMAPDGIGPLSLPHLRHMVLGSVHLFIMVIVLIFLLPEQGKQLNFIFING